MDILNLALLPVLMVLFPCVSCVNGAEQETRVAKHPATEHYEANRDHGAF